MALDAQGYFQHLKSYLNMDYYATQMNMHNELHLKEKIYIPKGSKLIKISFKVEGEAFAIKLDKEERKGHHLPLFHFLDNEGKPWSRRCDFVIFHLHKKKINVYCLEFKYNTLKVDSVMAQLKSSEAWCRALSATINIYTGKRKRLNLTKYALSYCEDPSSYLDADNKYLVKEPSIRHYHYKDIDGLSLNELENAAIESIG